jgi:hypothetical protein
MPGVNALTAAGTRADLRSGHQLIRGFRQTAMITQATATAIALPEQFANEQATRDDIKLSLNRIAAVLQVVLATRRAAHSEEHAYWYTVARGM